MPITQGNPETMSEADSFYKAYFISELMTIIMQNKEAFSELKDWKEKYSKTIEHPAHTKSSH